MFPMVVRLEHIHNHLIESADTMRFRDVSEECISKFQDLFKKGHSPSSALNIHKLDMQLEYGADYVYEAADRANCPDLQFCHRLYQKIFQMAYGAASGDNMLHDLEAVIRDYNSTQGDECGQISQINEKLVIALCTPLMKRVHKHHKYSGELVFIDASGGMDRYDCRIFMLLTHSSCGGLPLGCIITTSESREAITRGLNMYKDILPDGAFYGRGSVGPVIFMSDDSEAERQSLHEIFPESILILCVFHLLQAVWRFLWDGKNSIQNKHRPQLFMLVKRIAYAKSDEDLETAYFSLQNNDTAIKYSKFLQHCGKMYNRRHAWALCYRNNMLVRGNQTNNYAEAAMRILKDHIFERVRAYNVVQLLDFLITRLESYYERRLTDLANGKHDVTVSKRFLPGGAAIPSDDVHRLTEDTFSVRSQQKLDTHYQVDMSLGTCSCFVGQSGAPCKHQYAVVRHYNITSMNFLPDQDEKSREELLFLATGSTNCRPGWFVPLPNAFTIGTMVNKFKPLEGCDGMQQYDSSATLNTDRVLHNEFDVHSSVMAQACCPQPCNTLAVKEVNTLVEGLQDATKALTDMLEKNPVEFSEPIGSFLKQFNLLKTESAVISALQTFGKYTGVALSLSHAKKN